MALSVGATLCQLLLALGIYSDSGLGNSSLESVHNCKEDGFVAGIVRPPTPVMGWTSWNRFHRTINQTTMQAQMDAIVRRNCRDCPSLFELGYNHVGLDDGWQKCKSGVLAFGNGSFHD